MSQPPPSYPVPSGYPPGQPPLPTKHRPSGWWFVLGAGLIVAAGAIGVGIVAWLVVGLTSTDARVPADGAPHEITVGTDGDRLVWRNGNDFQLVDCAITDLETGESVAFSPLSGDFTRTFGSDEWLADQRFNPGSGRLEVLCQSGRGPDQDIEIGPAPSVGQFIGGVVAAIAVPSLLGLFGLAVLIVTGILWSTRPAKPKH